MVPVQYRASTAFAASFSLILAACTASPPAQQAGQAPHDTIDFVKYASEDPLTGSIVTDWYSPPGKPNERLRVNVFILSRALRSDSITVTVDRQELSRTGQWAETTIARQVETDLENAILTRARQLKRAWAPPQS